MFEGRWEQRWHPLREEWVIIAAHRQDRPWTGETLGDEPAGVPDFVADCYLCPGNLRSSGQRNPRYESTFVFDNDHPCVGPDAPTNLSIPAEPYRVRPATGVSRVVCFSPRHDLTLAEMESMAAQEVMGTWQKEFRDLARRPDVAHVLMFENKGKAVGVSNPHPHGQIYATDFVFKTIANEVAASARYRANSGRILFVGILEAEAADGRRILYENDTAVAFVPYFARYAYEVIVAPKRTHPSIASLSDAEVVDFTAALQHVLVKFDNLWRMSFPYVMLLHQAPTDENDYGAFHFHAEFHPPLRKPNLLKYLAGPEVGGGNFLSDTVPEEKAAELRAVPDVHYRHVPER
ncbi:MAG TPA: galactose-1-phosphate uridylyltransferase [Vicinamibacteria bacterium]|nr:galactose-1-phosphate uridylyltransferase [Vicinamibacteria bacterium]